MLERKKKSYVLLLFTLIAGSFVLLAEALILGKKGLLLHAGCACIASILIGMIVPGVFVAEILNKRLDRLEELIKTEKKVDTNDR